MLSGAEPRRATFDDDPAAYILDSGDGGLNRAPVDDSPVTADSDNDSLIAAASTFMTLDGWVVIFTTDATFATDGDTWICVDVPSGDLDGVDAFGSRLTPIGLRGAVMSGWDMEWILLPSG